MYKLVRLTKHGFIELAKVSNIQHALTVINNNGGFVVSVRGNTIITENATYEVKYV